MDNRYLDDLADMNMVVTSNGDHDGDVSLSLFCS